MAFTKIEVGGNFNLTDSQLHAECDEIDKRISDIFKDWKYYTLTSSGREALSLLLENWQPEHKVVLLPEYLCHTEIEPFKKKGYKIVYYRINIDLTPVVASVDSVVSENPGACLYAQSYFGKDTLQSLRESFRKFRREYGVSIIEDRTQIWLSDTPIDSADFYVTSLRKWLEIPDGGLLSSQMHDVSSFEKHPEVKKLSDLFSRTLFWGGIKDNDSDSKANGILMLVGLVFLILAPIFGSLMQLALSRKREFLADSTAVEFTRNPDGLISALEKLENDPNQLKSANNATANMYIVNPFKKNGKKRTTNIWSTHPSTADRIEALRNLKY